LSPEPVTTETKVLRVPAALSSIEKAKSFVVEIATAMGFGQLDLFQLELVMDEACTNAVDHGSTCNKSLEVIITCVISADKLVILVKDFGGRPFNPQFFERLAEKKTWGMGGRGIKIIKEIMDEVMYVFLGGKSTLLYMSKRMKKGEQEKRP
jgi:serine/threonine-protein kinase RsbW